MELPEFNLNPDSKLVASTKERMEQYLEVIKVQSELYLKNQFVVEKNKCGSNHVVTQTGTTIWESSQDTHWVFQTHERIPDTKPPQYSYKVMVINPRNLIFDTVYPAFGEFASEHKCMEYVLRWQEAKYKFSWKELTVAQQKIAELTTQFDEFVLIVGEEYGKEYQARIDEIHAEIRKNLEIE